MFKKVMRFIIATFGSLLGALLVYIVVECGLIHLEGSYGLFAYIGAFLAFGFIFFLLSPAIIGLLTKITDRLEKELEAIALQQIVAGGAGLILGLIIAALITQPMGLVLEGVPIIGSILRLLFTAFIYLTMGYLGISLFSIKKDEWQQSLKNFRLNPRERKNRLEFPGKILDTSAIIDGRIADILDAGFLEGEIIVPVFVLTELQSIADSEDNLRRQKGRRGLDIINQIKQNERIKFSIVDEDFPDVLEVDSKLVQLALESSGTVITTDFNLNKLASVQGIEVLNINDLANAMKPPVIPGEEMTITVIKDGKEHNQGLGYLDDGTMIVVEDGREHIGHTIEVLVTSILQTSAGKMIFARPK